MKQRAQFTGQYKTGVIGTMIKMLWLDKIATWVRYTPVDLFQLFEKVIIHEVRTQTDSTSAMYG